MGSTSSSQQVADAEYASFFTKEELNKMKSGFETGGVEKVKLLIKQKVSELDKTELNIAVTGESGTGKSTFINAMRGVQNSDFGAAKVGFTETTMEPAGYPHPNFSNVRYWDLPGIGSTDFPADTYLKKMKFEKYNFFIIISASRFKANDAKLANEIKRLGKKFYFVRTKIDADFDSMRKQELHFNEKTELECIQNDCCQKLRDAGILAPTVFLISSIGQDRYDFNQLTKALEDDLPPIMKTIFVLAYLNRSVEIILKKKKMLEKQVWMLATLSGAVGADPIGLSFGYDIRILIVAIIHFRKCLCLDDASLQRLANITNNHVEKLKEIVKTPLLGEINEDTIIRLHWGDDAAVISVVELAIKCIPIIGSIFGAGSSFFMTYKILTYALEGLTEDAVRVMKFAFGKN